MKNKIIYKIYALMLAVVLIFCSGCSSCFTSNPINVNPVNWALKNEGQIVNGVEGQKGIDINIVDAWKKIQGIPSVIVAVVDSGINTHAPSIQNAIYQNSDPINGVDDDQNGYVDDLNGWNFYHGNNQIFSDTLHDYHGTTVASTIAGGGEVNGVAPHTLLLPVKFMQGSQGDIQDAVQGIKYAHEMGASIVNCSWDCAVDVPELRAVIQEYDDMLFICAAGKNGNDLNDVPIYPACYDLPNIVSVAAVDSKGKLINNSGYGDLVDIAAPGDNIYCAFSENEYDYFDGTSYATAYVSGIAALIKSYNPNLSAVEIANILKQSNQRIKGLKVASEGIIDAGKSLRNAK